MDLHVSVKAETLFSIGSFHFTNSFLTMLIVMAFLILAGHLIARRAAIVPGRLQAAVETIVQFLLSLVESTAGPRVARRIFPLVAGLFIFILFSNYAGLLPGVGTIGVYEEYHQEDDLARIAAVEGAEVDVVVPAAEEGKKTLVPLLRSPSADLNMTLAMAFLVVVIVQVAGVAAHGVVGRIKHMADPWWIFPLELIAEVARIVSLSFRLFGNIFAGEVLITVMIGFAAVAFYTVVLSPVTTVFLYLEVLFGFIQALVFALLTLIYISLATAGGHGDEHGEAAHAH
jgi:F-type H+-transporting ATPase subunit a